MYNIVVCRVQDCCEARLVLPAEDYRAVKIFPAAFIPPIEEKFITARCATICSACCVQAPTRASGCGGCDTGTGFAPAPPSGWLRIPGTLAHTHSVLVS